MRFAPGRPGTPRGPSAGARRSRSTAIGNKQLPPSVRGFRTMKTTSATTKGFEVMRALRKGEARALALHGGLIGEASNVERAFGARPCARTKTIAQVQNPLSHAPT